ncbi:hypothetical protein [Streptacidiphilus neutrinimicus]|uniref:hypothetical protein n=1 Tax=Streptacidiphilus neutrinimicus TaxID=105420 RepID=UPI0005A9B1E9|nr:hypothetical protein [Streptacidiphilus neutrinimicus]
MHIVPRATASHAQRLQPDTTRHRPAAAAAAGLMLTAALLLAALPTAHTAPKAAPATSVPGAATTDDIPLCC